MKNVLIPESLLVAFAKVVTARVRLVQHILLTELPQNQTADELIKLNLDHLTDLEGLLKAPDLATPPLARRPGFSAN